MLPLEVVQQWCCAVMLSELHLPVNTCFLLQLSTVRLLIFSITLSFLVRILSLWCQRGTSLGPSLPPTWTRRAAVHTPSSTSSSLTLSETCSRGWELISEVLRLFLPLQDEYRDSCSVRLLFTAKLKYPAGITGSSGGGVALLVLPWLVVEFAVLRHRSVFLHVWWL